MIKWNKSYSTGDETIDSHHKLLFEFINDLNKEIVAGKPVKTLEEHLNFLINYAKFHFCYEESCMERSRCPAAQKNKTAHEEFIEFCKTFEIKFKNGDCEVAHIAELHHFIENWIVRHIQKIDVQLKPCHPA